MNAEIMLISSAILDIWKNAVQDYDNSVNCLTEAKLEKIMFEEFKKKKESELIIDEHKLLVYSKIIEKLNIYIDNRLCVYEQFALEKQKLLELSEKNINSYKVLYSKTSDLNKRKKLEEKYNTEVDFFEKTSIDIENYKSNCIKSIFNKICFLMGSDKNSMTELLSITLK